MEFHISRRSREKYHADETLFSYDGNVIFANFHGARVFAQRMNAQKDLVNFPEQAVKASQLNAIGLIDEIFHHVVKLFREQKAPGLREELLSSLIKKMPESELHSILDLFVNEFPPSPVFSKRLTSREYLRSSTADIPNYQLVLEEIFMLWLTLQNPALDQFKELFYEKGFVEDRRFLVMVSAMKDFLVQKPHFGPLNQSLVEMLLTPSREVPNSVTGQLEYIRDNWGSLIGDYLIRLLSSLDLVKEENKLSFFGPGKIPIPVYDQAEFARAGGSLLEPEAFSLDRDWMPRLVLIAKNTYVWLHQLSLKYQREIIRLDQIPAEELENLARWGFTGLWLIGLWERSPSSARIKNLCGNPDAISSAYSLFSYQIAGDLGGDFAYERLRDTASRFGIRLASDMVPNHMGIDSDWVIHHPKRFLSMDHSPFPAYQFTGENLSSDPNVTIQIEDHYYDRSDAAVVFRRQDNRSGDVKYFYHGNDGTSMPWNDTAQLNYLNPETREAVIQTILSVAQKFPIIRFDAAMTLAKKHYQRLWFPQPGTGGAIPSRAEFGLLVEDFNRAMPEEFWREVVDRAAVEAPDTLLLAEAFWLMEGYFVRSLGMHRVYNSAFMNMLRNEDNAGYRRVIKNTLEFEPEILKRFVNFMNNPDERTAVEQFGKGDKYFGICMLMATLPGLPMIGHGQVEGYSEKYGMEFRRPYWEETVDLDLVSRHEHEIFPLFHRRRLFAGVDEFWLFDFFTSGGDVNENVYAFSNRTNDGSALILFNNNFHETEGWIQTSVNQKRKQPMGNKVAQIPLIQALGLEATSADFVAFRDQVTNLTFLRPLNSILSQGLHFNLRGYEHHAFLDFRLLTSDKTHDYNHLYQIVGEQGVYDLDQALSELLLRPILEPYNQLVNMDYLGSLADNSGVSGIRLPSEVLDEFQDRLSAFVYGIYRTIGEKGDPNSVINGSISYLSSIMMLNRLDELFHLFSSKKATGVHTFIKKPLLESNRELYALFTWSILSLIGKLFTTDEYENASISWMDEWQLLKPFSQVLEQLGTDRNEIQEILLAIRIAVQFQNWYQNESGGKLSLILQKWLSDPDVQSYLRVNRYKDVLWYNREAFRSLTWWMTVIPIIKVAADEKMDADSKAEVVVDLYKLINQIKRIEKKSEYQIEKLLELARRSR